MTIWINNPFDFLPGEGARLQRYGLLAQAFAAEGHRVIWWSSDWSHVEKRRREVLKFESSKVLKLGEENFEHSTSSFANTASTFAKATADKTADRSNIHLRQGYGGQVEHPIGEIEIRLIKTMAYERNVGVRRLVSHWRYAKRWEREALGCDPADRPDLIICSTPPLSTGWVMRRLCKHFACKGVVDVMDLWPETFERVVPAFFLWPLRWMATRVYQGADAISAVGDSYLEAIREKYQLAVAVGSGEDRGQRTEVRGSAFANTASSFAKATADKTADKQRSEKPMYRCYHGIGGEVLKCESSKVLKLEAPRQGEAVPGAEGPLRLVYVGNMGRGYDLETVVGAVKELIEEGVSISLDLAGGGEQEPRLKALAQKQGAIRFHGVVTGEALHEMLDQADVGIIPLFTNTFVAVPYKLADYTAHSLPVVNSLAGETAKLLDQYGCGWHYEAGSQRSLKQALREVAELKQRDAGAFEARRAKARQLAQECFDAARIYPAFVAFLLPLSGSKGVIKSNAFQA